jgi:hypothetical protein
MSRSRLVRASCDVELIYSCANVPCPCLDTALACTAQGNVVGGAPVTRTVLVDAEEDTVRLTASHKATFILSEDDVETPYYTFPFDVHNITLTLASLPEVDLTDCKGEWLLSAADAGDAATNETMVDLTKLEALTLAQASYILPSSGEWQYDPDETKGPQISLSRSAEAPSACNIYIRIKRVSLVYAMKAFLPDMVVTSAGMFVMFINPQIPPLFGGRCTGEGRARAPTNGALAHMPRNPPRPRLIGASD